MQGMRNVDFESDVPNVIQLNAAQTKGKTHVKYWEILRAVVTI